jgi:hypothetical protein
MRALGIAIVVVAVLLGIYGIYLIATPDADGGRRPFGVMMGISALVAAVIGSWLIWASHDTVQDAA